MKRSEQITELAKALVAFQTEVSNPKNIATNEFANGHRYAPLGEILATVRPVLGKHGLAVMQDTRIDGSTVVITTILFHESGEWIESEPLVLPAAGKGGVTAQTIGAAITYGRRYQLSALLGISSEDDDDANSISVTDPSKPPQSPSQSQKQPKQSTQKQKTQKEPNQQTKQQKQQEPKQKTQQAQQDQTQQKQQQQENQRYREALEEIVEWETRGKSLPGVMSHVQQIAKKALEKTEQKTELKKKQEPQQSHKLQKTGQFRLLKYEGGISASTEQPYAKLTVANVETGESLEVFGRGKVGVELSLTIPQNEPFSMGYYTARSGFNFLTSVNGKTIEDVEKELAEGGETQ